MSKESTDSENQDQKIIGYLAEKTFFPTHTFRNKTSKPASEEWSNPALKLQGMKIFRLIKEKYGKD